jgi:hypothetical protein
VNKRWINTKVEFIWDGSQYVEQSSEGYWYDGEMALCLIEHEDNVQINTGGNATLDIGTFEGTSTLNIKSDNEAWLYLQTSAGNWNFHNQKNDSEQLRIRRDTTEIMALKTDGKIGIGTTAPSAILHVTKEVASDYQVKFHNLNGSAQGIQVKITGNDTATLPAFDVETWNTGGGYTSKFRVQRDGKVGIGTNAPSRLLTVTSAGQADLTIRSGDTSWAQLMFGDTSADNRGGVIYNNDGDYMHLCTEITDSSGVGLTIDPNQNVGIRTMSPAVGYSSVSAGQTVLDIGVSTNTHTAQIVLRAGDIYDSDSRVWWMGPVNYAGTKTSLGFGEGASAPLMSITEAEPSCQEITSP